MKDDLTQPLTNLCKYMKHAFHILHKFVNEDLISAIFYKFVKEDLIQLTLHKFVKEDLIQPFTNL